jgi:transcriptional regulator with XRE-family HTH domain
MTLIEFLEKQRCEKFGMGENEFADYLGMSRTTYYWLKKGRKASPRLLDTLSFKLNVPKEKLNKLQGGLK